MTSTRARMRLTALAIALVAVLVVGAGCTVATRPGPPESMLRLLELVNRARADNGVAPLQPCVPLGLAAAAHSKDMADHGFLGHTGSDGSQPGDRAIGYQHAGFAWDRGYWTQVFGAGGTC